MTDPAIVLFGIRSAVRLGQQVRQSYVDATKARALTLPLPNFPVTIDHLDAVTYFQGEGKRHADRSDRLQTLIAQATWSDDEKRELMESRTEYLLLDRAEHGNLRLDGSHASLSPEAWNTALTIRQWRRDPHPSALQRVAGTLVEVGVDYFASTPGALNKNSREGKLLASFLESLDDVEFATVDLGELPERLMVAAIEVASDRLDLWIDDDNVRRLVQATSTEITRNVAARIATLRGPNGNLQEEMQVMDWADLVFRSVLSGAGRLAAEDPATFLGVTDAGENALVRNVGSALLDVVLDEPTSSFADLLTRDAIESLAHAALKTLGDHPQLVTNTDNEGVVRLIRETAIQLSAIPNLADASVLPEVARIVIERTGHNLDLIWPDLAKPKNHIGLVAAKTTLAALSTKPKPGHSWRPRFTKQQLVSVVDAVIDDVVARPGWILTKAGKVSPALKAVLESVLEVLRKRGDNRLSTETAVEILRMALQTAALRKPFLDKFGTGRNVKPILTALVDAVLASVFAPDSNVRAAWVLVGDEAVQGVLHVVLEETAAAAKLNAAQVAVVEHVLEELHADLKAGRPLDLDDLASRLATSLAA